jgi:hypothetical protein
MILRGRVAIVTEGGSSIGRAGAAITGERALASLSPSLVAGHALFLDGREPIP